MTGGQGGRPRQTDPAELPQRLEGDRRIVAAINELIQRAGGSARVIAASPAPTRAGLKSPQRISEALGGAEVEVHKLTALIHGCAEVLGEDAGELTQRVLTLGDSSDQSLDAARVLHDTARQVEVLLSEARPTAAADVAWVASDPLHVVRAIADGSVDDATDLVCAAVDQGHLSHEDLELFLSQLEAPQVTTDVMLRALHAPRTDSESGATTPRTSITDDHRALANRWAALISQGRVESLAQSLIGELKPRGSGISAHIRPLEPLPPTPANTMAAIALMHRSGPAALGRLLTAMVEHNEDAGRDMLNAIGLHLSNEDLRAVATGIHRPAFRKMMQLGDDPGQALWAVADPSALADYMQRRYARGYGLASAAYDPADRFARAVRIFAERAGAVSVAGFIDNQITEWLSPTEGWIVLRCWYFIVADDRDLAARLLACSLPYSETTARTLNFLASATDESTQTLALLLSDALGHAGRIGTYYFLQVIRTNLSVAPEVLEYLFQISPHSMGALFALWAGDDASDLQSQGTAWRSDGHAHLADAADRALEGHEKKTGH